jgi:glycosyltransferase involved in cell wall biosynthesis
VKVLFYNHTGQVGGAERLLLLLLEKLDRSAFDPIVVCPDGPFRQLVSKTGVGVQTVPDLRARFTWRLDRLAGYAASFAAVMRQLRYEVSAADPDLIHANSVRAGLVATLATIGLRPKVVWHIHDLLPRHPFNLLIRAIAAVSGRTRLIAVAQASADRFAGNFERLRARVTVIPNAVDLEKFTAHRSAGKRIRRQLLIEPDAPVIGLVGRLTPAKGQLEMVKLWPQVLREFPAATLVLVGAPTFNNEHEYLELLEQTISDLQISDRVRLLGSRPDVADILQALDLLVVNSKSEACSLVILEAMACETAVVATSTGGTPELIEHGENGWLVPWGADEALANGIIYLLRQPEVRARLASRARRRLSAFSLDRLVSDIERFYLSSFAAPSRVTDQIDAAEIKTAKFA